MVHDIINWIITPHNSFKNIGASPYTLGLLGHSTWKNSVPSSFGHVHAMNPDPYTGLFGGKNCR